MNIPTVCCAVTLNNSQLAQYKEINFLKPATHTIPLIMQSVKVELAKKVLRKLKKNSHRTLSTWYHLFLSARWQTSKEITVFNRII